MDSSLIQSAIQASIAVVLEDGEIEIGGNASLLGRFDQLLVMFFQFIAKKQPFLIFFKLLECLVIGQLLSSGLYGKVGLACCNHWVGRVTILYDQIAGVGGELDIVEFM